MKIPVILLFLVILKAKCTPPPKKCILLINPIHRAAQLPPQAKCAFEKPGYFGRTNFCRFDNSHGLGRLGFRFRGPKPETEKPTKLNPKVRSKPSAGLKISGASIYEVGDVSG